MKTNKAYTVEFKTHDSRDVKQIIVYAPSKVEAYDKAMWELIPEMFGTHAYSAWVAAVTYQNGNYRMFNTFEGKPY